MHPLSPEELGRIESVLYARLRATGERHNQAKIEKFLADTQEQLGLGHPHGRSTALTAARIYREAIEEYFVALNDFTDFILNNLPPDRTTQK